MSALELAVVVELDEGFEVVLLKSEMILSIVSGLAVVVCDELDLPLPARLPSKPWSGFD